RREQEAVELQRLELVVPLVLVARALGDLYEAVERHEPRRYYGPVTDDIAQQAINTIRALSMDTVQKANSGHPGLPMEMAPAAYLDGHVRVSRLVYRSDDNDVSVDGPTALSFNEDTTARFEAYGWHVQDVADGNDLPALELAIDRATREDERPSLIRVRSIIGY